MLKGIPYFPLECTDNSKLELVRAECGLTGFAIIVKLVQKIYGQNGYYCDFNDDVLLLFCNANGVDSDAVSHTVAVAVKRGLFDKKLFKKYGILTSEDIQRSYFAAVRRRKKIEVDPEYLLVEFDNSEGSEENVGNSEKNADNSEKNDDDSQQRKENKTKENDTTANHTKEKRAAAPDGDSSGECAPAEKSSCDDDGKYEESFERFWNEYPKRLARQDAFTAWKELAPDDELVGKIVDSLKKHKKLKQWQTDQGRYIPYPAKWLKDRRWEDRILSDGSVIVESELNDGKLTWGEILQRKLGMPC